MCLIKCDLTNKLLLFLALIFLFTIHSCDKKETDEVDITNTEDVTPPTPDPMTWSVKPTGISKTSVSMTATTATDPGGVEYYFEALSTGGHSSDWQTAPVYIDQGLIEGNTYAYKVKARDKSGNETAFSEEASAKTEADITPPNPDPMTWAVQPVSIGATSISMIATTATDPGGVEYYFEALSAGGHSSGWQTAPIYVDKGLIEGNTYIYKVKARDLSGNETGYSEEASAITNAGRKPIITGDMLKARGENINGPSLIRVPDWIPPAQRADPDANYYLYFANHEDSYIRMAWAANVMGPYTIYKDGTGVLHLNNIKGTHLSVQGHIASPDVHVDEDKKQIIMYYHGGLKWNDSIPKRGQGQYTGVVTSEDGLDFNNGIVDMIICEFYARVFSYNGDLYAFATEGKLYKARDPENPWVNPPPGQNKVNIIENGGLWEFISGFNPWDSIGGPFDAFDAKLRHNSVVVKGDIVEIYYSRYFQTPERIEFSTIDFSKGIYNLTATSPVTVMEPEYDWEGADLPLEMSGIGSATGVRQLRDPYLFTDIDGTEYLLYSGRGEEAIGIVLLSDVMP